MNKILNYSINKKVTYQPEPRKGQPQPLLAPFGLSSVVGIRALPGTAQNTLTFNKIMEIAVREAKMLYEAGIKTIMIQNVNDLPMHVNVGKQIVAYMSAIGYAVRTALPDDCVLGVSVLRDDGEAMVSVASAMEADFIRPKTYVGAVVGVDGVHAGIINEVLEMRCKLKCDVQIWPDIHDRSTSPLGDVSLVDACQQAVSQGLADALFITGKDFEDSKARVKMVKESLPDTYVFLGGGANLQNLEEVYKLWDGIIIASALKDSGNMTGNLDQKKLDQFMAVYRDVVAKGKK